MYLVVVIELTWSWFSIFLHPISCYVDCLEEIPPVVGLKLVVGQDWVSLSSNHRRGNRYWSRLTSDVPSTYQCQSSSLSTVFRMWGLDSPTLYVCLVFLFGCIHLHGQSFISCFRDLSIQLCSQTVFPSTSILAPAPSPVYVSLIYWKVILFILNSVMQTNSTEKKNSLEIWHCWFLARRYISPVLCIFFLLFSLHVRMRSCSFKR